MENSEIVGNDKIKEIIDLYYSKKKHKNNDYILKLDEAVLIKVMNPTTNEFTIQSTKEISSGTDLLLLGGGVVTKKRIEELSPDNIDNKEFWKYVIKKFPHLSISGYPECKNEEEVNKANLNLAIWTGMVPKINDQLKINKDSKILEIGPGYGNLFNFINKTYQDCNYLAIDINPLFFYDGLFECDGKSIPDELGKDFDFIFSNNVFQHLSKKQRSSYYKDIYDRLIPGGKFVFSNFLLTEENKDMDNLWSYKDKDGNCYVTFFSQLTIVDTFEGLADELNDIGFSIKISLKQNSALIDCTKI